jgi:cytochrome P450
MHVVDQSFKPRTESSSKRNDLLDLMIEAVDGHLEDAEEQDLHASDQFEKGAKLIGHVKKQNLSYDDVVSTAMFLLSAGYDTTGTGLSWILYDLAMNPNCHDTLYDEIKDAGKDSSQLYYETLQTLPYLDAVIHESLRRYTPIAWLERVCTKDYKVPASNITIRKGDIVRASNAVVFFDPDTFSNPLEYNPDNFSKAYSSDRNPYSFLTFSLSPRNCIGMRCSMIEMKVCISSLVSKFCFFPCDKLQNTNI